MVDESKKQKNSEEDLRKREEEENYRFRIDEPSNTMKVGNISLIDLQIYIGLYTQDCSKI